jgi:hypothetical protein
MEIDHDVTVDIWVNQDVRRQTKPVAKAEQIGSNHASTAYSQASIGSSQVPSHRSPDDRFESSQVLC